jgi:hypothetical protein
VSEPGIIVGTPPIWQRSDSIEGGLMIEKSEFTAQALLDIYKTAYMDATMDDDGDISVKIDGIKVGAIADPDRGFFSLRAIFGVRPTATRQQILELCNRLNDHLVMARFCLPDATPEPCMYVDHFTVLEGGITGEEVVNATRRIVTVIGGGFARYDTDDVIA